MLVAALAVSLLSSCSFWMRSLPSDWNPHQPPRCTESTAAPALDTLAAVPLTLLGPVLSAASLAAGASCEGEECFGAAIGLVYSVPITLVDIVYVSAAVYGFRKADRCSKAHKAHQLTVQPASSKP